MSETASFADLFVDLELPPPSVEPSAAGLLPNEAFLEKSAFPSPNGRGSQTSAEGATVFKAGDPGEHPRSDTANVAPRMEPKQLPKRSKQPEAAKSSTTIRETTPPETTGTTSNVSHELEEVKSGTSKDAQKPVALSDNAGASISVTRNAHLPFSTTYVTSVGASKAKEHPNSVDLNASTASLASILNAVTDEPASGKGGELNKGDVDKWKGNARIKDLCDGDRAKLARLVRKLATTVAERDASRREIATVKEVVAKEESSRTAMRVGKLKKQNKELALELQRTKAKLSQSMKLLTKLQERVHQTPRAGPDEADSKSRKQDSDTAELKDLRQELTRTRENIQAEATANEKLRSQLLETRKEVEELREKAGQAIKERDALHGDLDTAFPSDAGEGSKILEKHGEQLTTQERRSARQSTAQHSELCEGIEEKVALASIQARQEGQEMSGHEASVPISENMARKADSELRQVRESQASTVPPPASFVFPPSAGAKLGSGTVPALDAATISQMLEELKALRTEVASMKSKAARGSLEKNRQVKSVATDTKVVEGPRNSLHSPPRPVRKKDSPSPSFGTRTSPKDRDAQRRAQMAHDAREFYDASLFDLVAYVEETSSSLKQVEEWQHF